MLIALLACTAPDAPIAELPPADSAPRVDDTSGPVPLDTAPDTGLDQEPDHRLYLHQEGAWSLSPFGGPYTHMVGSLITWEHLDGERALDTADTGLSEEPGLVCETRWTLVGAAAESTCDGCDAAFDIEFTLVEGDDGPCLDPELPASGDVLRFGYIDADRTIVHDVGGAGLWLPWWTATRAGDDLTFTWDAVVGVVPQDDP